MRKCLVSFSLVVVLSLCFASGAIGQGAATTGTVTGTITDSQGAAVADAQVSLTDTSTNLPLTTNTSEAGRYVFVNVQPGTYNLMVSKSGFRVAKVGGK